MVVVVDETELIASSMQETRILYCHCAYAQIIPEKVKSEVLEGLAASGASFDAVADLCEMSARKDPALLRLASGGGVVKIAACYPRAVKWLFHAAGAPLPKEGVEVRNMRIETAGDVVAALLNPELDPAHSLAETAKHVPSGANQSAESAAQDVAHTLAAGESKS